MSFTIIVPSFNQAQYLSQALDSILSQPELKECLVFDADSTDGSKEILKKYARKYPKLWYQSKKDGGQANAINQGLKRAKGEFVAYLNSDDFYLPGSFSKVKEYFDTHPDCLWIVGDCAINASQLKWTFDLKHLWPIDRHQIFLQIFNTVNQPAVFLRNNFVKKIGFFNTRFQYAFDYDYWLRCLVYARPHRLHQKLALFRVHQFSKGSSNYQSQFAEDLRVVQQNANGQLIYTLHHIIANLTILCYKLLKRW